MIGLEEGREGWTEQHVLVLFAVAAVALALFVAVELRVAEPLIPPRLFTNHVVLASACSSGCAPAS